MMAIINEENNRDEMLQKFVTLIAIRCLDRNFD